MGKTKKLRFATKLRHAPLNEQLTDSSRVKERVKKKREDKATDNDEQVVDSVTSGRILEQALLQQAELSGAPQGPKRVRQKVTQLSTVDSSGEETDDDDDDDDDESIGSMEFPEYEVSVEDQKILEQFLPHGTQKRQTLQDVIMEKIKERRTEVMSEAGVQPPSSLDDRVIAVYKDVAVILSKYRSGKLPKAFKVIPHLQNWEEVLELCEPDKWTAASMFQATKLFTASFGGSKAQKFYNLVLLPRIRDDIAEYKRLNHHLYMAIKKALFRPAAFFKGLLLSLCESGTCTLREAVIISSVLIKTSIPVLHSCAALLKLAEMDYSGANCIFIRALLDKKYALPYRVVDAVFFHFYRFLHEDRHLPVLWHQSLLAFVQGYKEDMSPEQKECLLELMRKHEHHQISEEVRKQIIHSKSRGIDEQFEPLS
ncbi:bystin-like [Dysidea avara]|uniref:bystin-like n=1 Tax=Dysidea avara TaxID=196820 RepID=UPI00333148BC